MFFPNIIYLAVYMVYMVYRRLKRNARVKKNDSLLYTPLKILVYTVYSHLFVVF